MIIGLTSCRQPAAPPAPEKVPSAADKAAELAAVNEAAARRLMDEVLTKGNVALLDEILAPDFVEHQQFPPDVPPGAGAVKWFVENFRPAFPDLTITIDQVVASGDLVAVRSTWRGTHKGEWMGMKPTGKAIEFESFDIMRFKDGKAVEHWGMDGGEQALRAAKESK
jgi:predicted ester cyclase